MYTSLTWDIWDNMVLDDAVQWFKRKNCEHFWQLWSRKWTHNAQQWYQQSNRFRIHFECSLCRSRLLHIGLYLTLSCFENSSTSCASFSFSIKRRADETLTISRLNIHLLSNCRRSRLYWHCSYRLTVNSMFCTILVFPNIAQNLEILHEIWSLDSQKNH